MHRVLVALWAMLLDFKTVWIISAVLARNVIAVFAIFTCQSDFWSDVVTSHVQCLSCFAT